jgi:hypothetical protein
MRLLSCLPFLVVFCAFSGTGDQRRNPSPPGLREGEREMSKPLEPPLTAKANAPDPAKLQHEADELAQLSAGVPSDLAKVAHGQLPKDLADKLKRIEKLAKHLRNELSQ